MVSRKENKMKKSEKKRSNKDFANWKSLRILSNENNSCEA